MACLFLGCERQQWPVAVCRKTALTASPLGRLIPNAQIPEHMPKIASYRPVCCVLACWLARRRCERMQAHNTVTPGIGQRTAIQGSCWVPYAQTNTSLSSWPTRIGVRVVLVHVGAHEMHEPAGSAVGHLSMKSRPGYRHLGLTSHEV